MKKNSNRDKYVEIICTSIYTCIESVNRQLVNESHTHCFTATNNPMLNIALVSKYAATFHSLDFLWISSLGTHVEREHSLRSVTNKTCLVIYKCKGKHMCEHCLVCFITVTWQAPSGIWIHRQLDGCFNSIFGLIATKTTGSMLQTFCEGNPPSQKHSNNERAYMQWRNHRILHIKLVANVRL